MAVGVKNGMTVKSDRFRVMLNGVQLASKAHPMHAVNVAQGMACNVYKEPVTLNIIRNPVLGPASLLYRVDRDSQGVVFTTTISEED